MQRFTCPIALLLLLFAVPIFSASTPRAFYQKVALQHGNVMNLVTVSPDTTQTGYIITADIVETPGETLTNAKAKTGEIQVFHQDLRLYRERYDADTLGYAAFYVNLGAFPTLWQPGNHLRISVYSLRSGTTTTKSIKLDNQPLDIKLMKPEFIIP